MRSRNLSFKFHIFNFKFVYHSFGEHTSLLLKRWIDLNYRLIRSQVMLRFLLRCKHNRIFPSHLSRFEVHHFHLCNWLSVSRLRSVLHNSKSKILDLEIYDLNRTCKSLKEELSHDSISLSNSLPSYIWNSITKHHLFSFNKLRYKLSPTRIN